MKDIYRIELEFEGKMRRTMVEEWCRLSEECVDVSVFPPTSSQAQHRVLRASRSEAEHIICCFYSKSSGGRNRKQPRMIDFTNTCEECVTALSINPLLLARLTYVVDRVDQDRPLAKALLAQSMSLRLRAQFEENCHHRYRNVGWLNKGMLKAASALGKSLLLPSLLL